MTVAASKYSVELTDGDGRLFRSSNPDVTPSLLTKLMQLPGYFNRRYRLRVIDRSSGVVTWEERHRDRQSAEAEFARLEEELGKVEINVFAARYDPNSLDMMP